jgi:hypothetical protein
MASDDECYGYEDDECYGYGEEEEQDKLMVDEDDHGLLEDEEAKPPALPADHWVSQTDGLCSFQS